MSDSKGYFLYNLGTGTGTSVLQIVEAYSKAIGNGIFFINFNE